MTIPCNHTYTVDITLEYGAHPEDGSQIWFNIRRFIRFDDAVCAQ